MDIFRSPQKNNILFLKTRESPITSDIFFNAIMIVYFHRLDW